MQLACEGHFRSLPETQKALGAPASESFRCLSIPCFCCSTEAAEACCACTLLWKKEEARQTIQSCSMVIFTILLQKKTQNMLEHRMDLLHPTSSNPIFSITPFMQRKLQSVCFFQEMTELLSSTWSNSYFLCKDHKTCAWTDDFVSNEQAALLNP